MMRRLFLSMFGLLWPAFALPTGRWYHNRARGEWNYSTPFMPLARITDNNYPHRFVALEVIEPGRQTLVSVSDDLADCQRRVEAHYLRHKYATPMQSS